MTVRVKPRAGRYKNLARYATTSFNKTREVSIWQGGVSGREEYLAITYREKVGFESILEFDDIIPFYPLQLGDIQIFEERFLQ